MGGTAMSPNLLSTSDEHRYANLTTGGRAQYVWALVEPHLAGQVWSLTDPGCSFTVAE
jgi:hypothetical protein